MDKFDKLMKEKLHSFKPSFEEQDWLAMEKMLDNRSRKFMLLSWWKYGVAAAAFVGIMGVCFLSYTFQKRNNELGESTIKSAAERVFSKESKQLNFTLNSRNSLANHWLNLPSISSNQQPMQLAHCSNHSTAMLSQPITNASVLGLAVGNLELKNSPVDRNEESVSIPTMSATLIAEMEEIPSFHNNGTEEVILQKKSRRLINFSVSLDAGALANISMETKTNAKELNIYSDGFSDAGVNFFVTLLNRVGLYTGIKYADRKSFSRPDSFELGINNRLLNAKSKIVGINIPIGIHFNIYDQKYCNVYTKIGINNIIPWQETIHYETIDNTNTTAMLVETTKNIGNTKFSASVDNGVSFDNKTISYSTSPTNALPIKHKLHQKPKEQYLAELQLSFGLKVKATRNLAFNLEPAYLLDLKNSHRAENSFNFALNTGITYSF
jgi:hypothetical protein